MGRSSQADRSGGEIFAGFELVERLGSGGMAEVFRAHPDTQRDRVVVIKRILSARRYDPALRELLTREAEIGLKLRHRNIVRVFDRGLSPQGEPFIVMEFVDGIDAKRLMWSLQRAEAAVPAWLAVHVVSEILAGIAHAHGLRDSMGVHAPVMHRDVSPENILVGRHGRIKLTDFGVALSRPQPDDLPRGKLPYMAPELFADGGQALSPRIDIFAAGVVLWELLTQRHLFRAQTPQEVVAQVCAQPRIAPSRINPGIPRLLDDLVLSALSPVPERRPASALDMQASLQRALDMLHPEGVVSDATVAEVVRAHLPAARVPSELIHERAIDNIEALLGLAADDLFEGPSAPSDAPETTYAIIRRPSAVAHPDDDRETTDELLRAYLQEAPIPARRGMVDTLDLAPGASDSASVTPGPDAYGGPFPVWVATPHGQHGPLKPARAFAYLAEQRAQTLEAIRLSGNGRRWISLGRLAYLLHDELVPAGLEMNGCEMHGRVEDTSLTAIVGTFGRGQTARVMLCRPTATSVERFELEFVDGQVVALHNNELFFRLWSSLLDNAYLGELGLTARLHRALLEDRRLEPTSLPVEAQTAIMQARSLTKRRSLDTLFSWTDGRFGSTSQVSATPDASSIEPLRLLPRLVARRVDRGWLQSRLTPYIERRLWRASDFQAAVEHLRLRRSERRRAEAFGYGRTLFESLQFANAEHRDVYYAYVLAFVMLELGLLHDRNPTYAFG